MSENVDRVSLALQQLERLLRALEDLRENVLPRDPTLFAITAEAPLYDLDRLRIDVAGFRRSRISIAAEFVGKFVENFSRGAVAKAFARTIV